MRVGLDRLPALPTMVSRLRGAKFGLLAHAASVDRRLRHIGDVLAELDLRPRRIFGPEHGYGCEAQDMVGVADAHDSRSGAPIISLYGERFEDLSPRPEHLEDLDLLLIDLCDIGSRYYTFAWTALLAVRAAARAGLRCILLDRPNPIGGLVSQVEGREQHPGFLSFVGLEPIPVRHSLTIGELVAEMAVRDGLSVGADAQLDVVGVEAWDRGDLGWDWDRPFVPPSPNMPLTDTALVYPGGCLLEGTNLSEGRGTTRPFEILGAPWLDGRWLAEELSRTGLEGFIARPVTFRPTFHKHAGTVCGGVHIHVFAPRAFRPLATYLAIVTLVRQRWPEHFKFRTERYEFVDDIPAFDLLVGNAETRKALERGVPCAELLRATCAVDGSYAEVHANAVDRVEAAQRGA